MSKKTIIAGSREIESYDLFCEAIRESGFQISEVVSGGARGVDKLGERYARSHSIPIRRFLADWKAYGRSAGPRRNQQMVDYVGAAGQLIAIWDGVSKGTRHTIEMAKAAGLSVFVFRVGAK